MELARPKDLVWIAGSRHDMEALPTPVRRRLGVALFAV
jgi:phage-related protein